MSSQNQLWIKYQKGQNQILQGIQFLQEGMFYLQDEIKCEEFFFKLYDKALFYFDKMNIQNPIGYIILDFDTHFELIRCKIEKQINQLGKPQGLMFIKQGMKFGLLSDDEQLIINWRNILRNIINQRGFHELYKAQKKIGKGNFASVYLAQRIEDQQNFAVKAFSKESIYQQENGKESLINEIELMRSLNHSNIIRLHEVFETDNSMYLILDLYTGGLLFDKMKARYKFQQEEIKNILKCLLEGLAEMHRNKIMHRDIKPENLIFKNQNSTDIAIVDLGLATRTDVKKFMFVRCGTPGFVAPEVINIVDFSLKYGSVCDIFSLGLIFHILLIGKSPFNGKDYHEILNQNRVCNITFEENEYQKVNPDALDLLKKMLQKDPNLRITADQALQHLYLNQLVLENLMEIEIDSYNEIQYKYQEENLKKRISYIGSNIQSPMPSPQIIQQKGGINKFIQDEQGTFRMPNTPILTGRIEAINFEQFTSPSTQIDQRFLMQMGSQYVQSPSCVKKSIFGSPNFNYFRRKVENNPIREDIMQEEKGDEDKNEDEKNRKSNIVRNKLRTLGV